jgi:hypothetical protein
MRMLNYGHSVLAIVDIHDDKFMFATDALNSYKPIDMREHALPQLHKCIR